MTATFTLNEPLALALIVNCEGEDWTDGEPYRTESEMLTFMYRSEAPSRGFTDLLDWLVDGGAITLPDGTAMSQVAGAWRITADSIERARAEFGDVGLNVAYEVGMRFYPDDDLEAEPSPWSISPVSLRSNGSPSHDSFEMAARMADAGNRNAWSAEHRVFKVLLGTPKLVEEYEPAVKFGLRA